MRWTSEPPKRSKPKARPELFLTVAALVAGATLPAWAQTAPSDSVGHQEIVVTAQRREQKLIDVPESISAETGVDLARRGALNAVQLADIVPGLTYSNNGTIPVFAIRGVTLNDYGLANESPIAIYVDDVYMAAPSTAADQLFDMSRVEVLRGPQGTLFGRNATGGLVHLISNKPTRDFEGEASIQFGSYDQVVVGAAMGGPINDRLRARAAFTYDRDEGWQYNATLNSRQAKTNTWASRIIIDFDMESSLLSETNVHGSAQNNLSQGYYNRGEFDPVKHSTCQVEAILANACVSPFGSRDPDPRPGTVYSDFAGPHNKVSSFGVGETLKYTGNGFTVTSITGFETSDKAYEEDSDGSPDPLIATDSAVVRTQYSEEVRANGSHGPARWVLGAFFFHEVAEDGFVSLLQIVPLAGTYGNQNQYFDNTTSAAAFGQIDYDLTRTLTFTVGGRYTSETKHLTISDDFAAPTYVDHGSAATNIVTWRTGLEWRLKPAWMVYANVSTGFKSQAFDTSLVLQGGAVAANPETDINYEIGSKAEFLDRHVQLSADLFYLSYSNFQLITIPPSATTATSELLNANGATVYGAEAELDARPARDLTLGLSATLLDTKINAPGLFIGPYPVTGAHLAYSPEVSVKGDVRYDADFRGSGTLSPHFDFVYNSLAESQIILDPLTKIPSYFLVNLGVRYVPPNSRFAIDIFIANLTDRSYVSYAGDFYGYNILQWAKPRTIAVRLSTNW